MCLSCAHEELSSLGAFMKLHACISIAIESAGRPLLNGARISRSSGVGASEITAI